MGYQYADVYNQPEKFGLTLVGSVDFGESYEFHIVAVFRHDDGRFFVGTDSGCSCPSPFEDFTSLDSLTELTSVAQLASELRGGPAHRGEVGELLGRFSSLL